MRTIAPLCWGCETGKGPMPSHQAHSRQGRAGDMLMRIMAPLRRGCETGKDPIPSHQGPSRQGRAETRRCLYCLLNLRGDAKSLFVGLLLVEPPRTAAGAAATGPGRQAAARSWLGSNRSSAGSTVRM